MFENRPLQKMFSAVPSSYDFLNRMLTFGFDQVWRKRAARECLENHPEKILDLCCGTGDLMLLLRKAATSGTTVMALDYSESMLDLARKKAKRRKIDDIEYFHADASSMPFPDNHFDSIGIAFAFRNLTFRNPDREKFLAEILRVLKPGGRFVIVETSQPRNKIFRKLFHYYLNRITPVIGGFISGHYGAYKYLGYSASHYYNNGELKEMMLKAGFNQVNSRVLLAGIAGLHIISSV